MKQIWLVFSLLLASCAPLRSAVNTQATPSLPPYAPLAAGQVWNVQGYGLVQSGETTVNVDKLFTNSSGIYANLDGDALRETERGNGSPAVTYHSLRQELKFVWDQGATPLVCLIKEPNVEGRTFKGRLMIGDNIVGDCTATLQ